MPESNHDVSVFNETAQQLSLVIQGVRVDVGAVLPLDAECIDAKEVDLRRESLEQLQHSAEALIYGVRTMQRTLRHIRDAVEAAG